MKNDVPVPAGQTIGDFLAGHNHGNDAHAISAALAQLVREVRDTDRKGSLSITITLTPEDKIPGAMMIVVDHKANSPVKPCADLFYSDDSGRLLKHDPRQLRMNIDSDPDGDTEVAEARRKLAEQRRAEQEKT